MNHVNLSLATIPTSCAYLGQYTSKIYCKVKLNRNSIILMTEDTRSLCGKLFIV
jgi:hypothetical protein